MLFSNFDKSAHVGFTNPCWLCRFLGIRFNKVVHLLGVLSVVILTRKTGPCYSMDRSDRLLGSFVHPKTVDI
jgi:hypothetical protein